MGEEGSRNTPRYATETGISAILMGHLARMQTYLSLRNFICLGLFLERMLMQNIPHENDLIFKGTNVQVTCIFIRIGLHRLVLPQRQKSAIHP